MNSCWGNKEISSNGAQGMAARAEKPSINDAAVDRVYRSAQKQGFSTVMNSFYVLQSIYSNVFDLYFNYERELPGMPVSFQEAVLIYIMSKKEKGNFSVSTQDIISAMSDLTAVLGNSFYGEKVYQQYKQIAPELLLIDGFKRYNDNPLNEGRQIQYKDPIMVEKKESAANEVLESLYEVAWFTENSQLNSAAVFNRICNNFEELKCDLLQASIVLAKSTKGSQGGPITADELRNALARLKGNDKATDEVKEILSHYEQMDLDALLHKGGLMSELGSDLKCYLRKKLPLELVSTMAQTSKENSVIYGDYQFWRGTLKEDCQPPLRETDSPIVRFRLHPPSRKEENLPIDQIGIEELKRQIGAENCDEITMQKIINGELTIANFKQPVEERPDELLPIDQKGRDYLKDVLDLDCGPKTLAKIMNKKLTVLEAKQLREEFDDEIKSASDSRHFLFCLYFRDKANHKYLLDGSLDFVHAKKDSFALKSEWHQKYIDSGKLDIELVCDMHFIGSFPLDYEGVRQGVDFLGWPIEMAIRLTHEQCEYLDNYLIRSLFDDKDFKGELFTFEKYITLNGAQLMQLEKFWRNIHALDVTVDEVINNSAIQLNELIYQRKEARSAERDDRINKLPSNDNCVIS